MEYIQSKDNRTLKRMISLGQRKYRQKYNEYMVEGVRTIRDLAERRQLKAMCIKESQLNNDAIQDLIKSPTTEHIRRYLVCDALFEKLENSVQGQGVVGIAEKSNYDIDNFRGEPGLYVLLDGVQNPGNLGTIIRTAVAAGAKALFLTKGTVDPYNDKTVRSAMSSMNEIAIYESLEDDDVSYLLEASGVTSYVTTLDEAVDYNEVQYEKATLLVMGSEGNGVTESIQNKCNQPIKIPVYGNIESLNVSIATALCLYKVRESWNK